MRFSMWLHARRRMLVKVCAAVVVAVAVGAGVGLAGALLTDDDGARTTAKPSAPAPSKFADVRVRVISAILHPAGTDRGRSRQRARMSVHVRVTNRRDDAVALDPSLLQSGTTLLETDPHADDLAAELLKPVPAGFTADGVLRYETSGAVTRRLTSTRRVALRIAGQTARAEITIGRPVTPR